MDHLPLDPEPYLVAILLVTSSRAGPRLVLHYPPEPSTVTFGPKADNQKASDLHGEESDSDDDADSSDDEHPQIHSSVLGDSLLADDRSAASVEREIDSELGTPTSPPASRLVPSMSGSALAQLAFKYGKKRPLREKAHRSSAPDSLERLFGVSRDGLAKLMAPSGNRRFWNGNKLEVGTCGRTFVGCPMFLKETDNQQQQSAKHDSVVKSPECTSEQQKHPSADEESSPAPSSCAESHPEELQTLEQTGTQDPWASSARPSVTSTTSTPAIPVRRPILNRNGITDHSQLGAAAGSLPSNASDDTQPTSALTMFNLILVLAPPPWEHHARVELAFEHIVQPLSRAMREAQRSGWLDNETRDLERIAAEWRRAHAAEKDDVLALYGLDAHLLDASHLYRTLSGVYNAVAKSELAFIDLKSTTAGSDAPKAKPTMSLQIPLPLNTPRAPAPGDPPMPALPVSTAALTVSGTRWRKRRGEQFDSEFMQKKTTSSVVFLTDEQVANDAASASPQEDIHDEPSLLDRYDALRIDTTAAHTISPHAAILLSYPLPDLLTQLLPAQDEDSTTGPLSPLKDPGLVADPLRYLLPALSPRLTLHQLAPRLPGLTLPDLSALACLLIRLRVARPIPPLHASAIFIVDPNADLSRLHGRAGRDFAACFPTLGLSLAEVLGKLNGASAWAALIPRKDAKSEYMDALAWLRREGFVAQLRTFAWVFASTEVRASVRSAMQREAEAELVRDDAGSPIPFAAPTHAHEDHSRDLLMAAVDARRHAAPRATSEAGSSTGSIRTTVPARAGTPARLNDETRPVSAASMHESEPAQGHAQDEADAEDAATNLREGLIQTPARCTPFESRCIAHIGSGLADEEGRRLWTRLVRHFDGETGVEEIAGIEGLKRKLVARVVGGWVDAGIVRVARHW